MLSTVLIFFSKNLWALAQISNLTAFLPMKLLLANHLSELYHPRRPSPSVLRLEFTATLLGPNSFWVTICCSLRAWDYLRLSPIPCFSGILFPWCLLELPVSPQQLSCFPYFLKPLFHFLSDFYSYENICFCKNFEEQCFRDLLTVTPNSQHLSLSSFH